MLWAASRPTASPGSHSERCHFSCSRVLNLETGQDGRGQEHRHAVCLLGGAWNYSLSLRLGCYFLTNDPLIPKFPLVTLECPNLPSTEPRWWP